MNGIGWAVKELEHGSRVRRQGWNGKGMYLFLVRNWTFTDEKNDNSPTFPFVAIKTVNGGDIPWNASQADLLATDWEVAG